MNIRHPWNPRAPTQPTQSDQPAHRLYHKLNLCHQKKSKTEMDMPAENDRWQMTNHALPTTAKCTLTKKAPHTKNADHNPHSYTQMRCKRMSTKHRMFVLPQLPALPYQALLSGVGSQEKVQNQVPWKGGNPMRQCILCNMHGKLPL